MALFRPSENTDPAAGDSPPATPSDPAKPAKKQVPTPSRKAAEEARRQRLHPTLTKKEAKAQERGARSAQRDEQFRKTESQPGKVLIRDFIDSRKGISSFAMPILMGSLLISLLATSLGTVVVALTSYLTWFIMLLIAFDVFMMWRAYKKLHAERLPNEPLKGLLAYGLNRAINLRRLRAPAPRVKPGDTI